MHESEKWNWNCVQLLATLWTIAYQAPPSMGFSRQGYWSGVPLPSPMEEHKMHKIIPERNTNFAHCSFCNSSMLLSYKMFLVEYFAVVQSLTHVWLFVTPWTAACQASLPFTISWSCLKFMSIESVIPSNHVILCHPLFLLPSIFPSIRIFSNESVLCIRWPKHWSGIEWGLNWRDI